MKHYTTEQQTAKLIELGLPKPKSILGHDGYWGYDYAYNIGELIEMLPTELEGHSLRMYHIGLWNVSYSMCPDKYYVADYELCDALFEMVCYLKEEGVI